MAHAILAPILGYDDFTAKSVTAQVNADSIDRHGVVFDSVIILKDGTEIDLEMQRQPKGADYQRIRYYAARFDASRLKKGASYRSLPPTIVVFLTNKDVLGLERPLYRIHRYLDDESGRPQTPIAGDSWIYIADMRRQDGSTVLGQLMRDLNAEDSKDIKNPILAKTMDEVKYERSQTTMDSVLKQMEIRWKRAMRDEVVAEVRDEVLNQVRDQVRDEVRAESRLEGRTDAILSLLRSGVIGESVAARELGIEIDELRRLTA